MKWRSDNLPIPLGQFARLFGLSEKELRREGISGRLVAFGIPEPGLSPTQWSDIVVSERSAREWVVDRRLPATIRAKVKRVGGLDALSRWRDGYFGQCRLDVAGDAIILPDGTRLEHPLFHQVTEH